MNYIVLNTFLAVVPAVLLLLFFYRQDKHKPEPGTMVLFSLVLGVLSTLPALAIGLVLDPYFRTFPPTVYILLTAYITAALVEEGCKLTVVYRYILPRPSFDEVSDGIVYTVGASMGFAILENILYSAHHPPYVLLLRGFTSVPLHATASGIMGYYIGRAKFEHPSIRYKGLALAVVIHGTYNFLLFTGTLASLLIIPLLVISWKRLRKLAKLALLEDRFFGRS